MPIDLEIYHEYAREFEKKGAAAFEQFVLRGLREVGEVLLFIHLLELYRGKGNKKWKYIERDMKYMSARAGSFPVKWYIDITFELACAFEDVFPIVKHVIGERLALTLTVALVRRSKAMYRRNKMEAEIVPAVDEDVLPLLAA